MYIFLVIVRNLHINYISLYFFNRNFRQAVQVHVQKKRHRVIDVFGAVTGTCISAIADFVQSRAADVASGQGFPCACSYPASSSSPRTKKRHRTIDVFGAVTGTCISAIADFVQSRAADVASGQGLPCACSSSASSSSPRTIKIHQLNWWFLI